MNEAVFNLWVWNDIKTNEMRVRSNVEGWIKIAFRTKKHLPTSLWGNCLTMKARLLHFNYYLLYNKLLNYAWWVPSKLKVLPYHKNQVIFY